MLNSGYSSRRNLAAYDQRLDLGIFTEHRRVPQYRRSLILQKQFEAAPARARYSAAYAEYFFSCKALLLVSSYPLVRRTNEQRDSVVGSFERGG